MEAPAWAADTSPGSEPEGLPEGHLEFGPRLLAHFSCDVRASGLKVDLDHMRIFFVKCLKLSCGRLFDFVHNVSFDQELWA